MNSYVTISGESTAEYVEKRSRFIATAVHCTCEKDALEFIERQRSKYWDARHNVYAYSVRNEGINRFSDDGEPHGTAGKPMLDVIVGSGVTDIAVVVTRYFGGVLLGTGGLVHAYSKATKDAIAAAKKVEKIAVFELKTICSYADHAKLNSLIFSSDGIIEDTVFTERIELTYLIKKDVLDSFLKNLSEAFSARIEAQIICEKTAEI
ncbi:MAG: YigZ family protein [Acutalibacteraceae bacterium]|nr:YigZ family protein [Acutalibacteraceae bacterium]